MQMEKKIMSPAMKGLLLGLVMIVISVVTYVFVPNFEDQRKYSWISYLLIAAGIFWACYSFSEQMNGNVTFGSVFNHGFKTTAVLAIIMIAYSVLAMTIIFPEMKEKGMEMARQQMEKDGKLTDSQIDQAIEMTTKYFLPFAIAGILVMYLIIGAIGSLIGAAIVKKNPNPTPFQ
jgi:NADH:ubiquinone oxidoreductase subunit 6 (subunit J)